MFEIKVHYSAPDNFKTTSFWCHFLVGTHWRKFGDNAEIVLERVTHNGWGKIECLCKAVNNKYSISGNVVRDFPIGYSSMGDWTNIETITKYGFFLVPDTILSKKWEYNDSYYNNMNNLGPGDYMSRRADWAYTLKGLSAGGLNNENPIALFNLGVPTGRVITIKGLVIGNECGPSHCYDSLGLR
ncbi:MAG: hypothetical protein IK004_02165 [Bacteroidales bacterium]|nr:hypothetical protein [Bacteroidales bacterium]